VAVREWDYQEEAPTRIDVGDTFVNIDNYQIDDREIANRLRDLGAQERQETVTRALQLGFKMLDFAQSSQLLEAMRREHQDGVNQIMQSMLKEQQAGSQQTQAMLTQMITTVTSLDGVLAKTTNHLMEKSVAPELVTVRSELTKVLNAMAFVQQQIAKQQGIQEIIEQTPKKGGPFEDEVLARCLVWARAQGGTVEHVGPDNQAGDVRITFAADGPAGVDLVIVVEARDREIGAGHKRIATDLAKAMSIRRAQAGIYVCKTPEGLAKEIGGFAEGTCPGGPYVATTVDGLDLAAKALMIRHRLAILRASQPATDIAAIDAAAQRLRIVIKKFAQHTANGTKARDAINSMQEIVEAVRAECQEIAEEIEASLRATPAAPEAAA
jgi:hypothetical protein